VVDVQVLLPEHWNHVAVDWRRWRYFHELLQASVRIFRYRHILVDSQTATISGVWSTVGLSNMDRYTLLDNYEIDLEVYSRRFAA
jgi:cardiolipin synthase